MNPALMCAGYAFGTSFVKVKLFEKAQRIINMLKTKMSVDMSDCKYWLKHSPIAVTWSK